MRPYSDINVGDIYGRGYPFNLEWIVVEKCDEEKLVLITPTEIVSNDPLFVHETWKKPSDQIFNRRVFRAEPPPQPEEPPKP